MTKARLLAEVDSYELTEWLAYLRCRAEEADKTHDGRISWNQD